MSRLRLGRGARASSRRLLQCGVFKVALLSEIMIGFVPGDRASDRFFERVGGYSPSVEVIETDKEIKISAELPGLDEKDVKIELANGVLAIAGEAVECFTSYSFALIWKICIPWNAQ